MRLSEASELSHGALIHQLDYRGKVAESEILVPYWVGAAGLGKTQAVKALAKLLGTVRGVEFGCYIFSLAQYSPEDIAGWLLPNDDKTKMNRIKPDWMPEEGTHGILFFDELPQAIVANQNVAAQIINEHRVGDWHIPSTWVVVAAGNRTSDRAGTTQMPSHLKDRLMFLPVEANHWEFIQHMMERKRGEQVCAFIGFKPTVLHAVNHDEDVNPTPRSWDKVCTAMIIYASLPVAQRRNAVAGLVGSAVAAEFFAFLAVYDEIGDVDEIIRDPASAPIPDRPDVVFAICQSLASKANDKNIGNIIKYINRLEDAEMGAEYSAFVMKTAIQAIPNHRQNKDVRDWIVHSGGKELLL